MADAHRVLPLFQPSGFIHNPGFQRLQMGNDFLPDGGPYALVAPGAARDQLLQDLRVHPQARRQRFATKGLTNFVNCATLLFQSRAFHLMPNFYTLEEFEVKNYLTE